MYLATQNNHSPYEVPQEYIDQFNSSWYQLQRQVAGMSLFEDGVLGNVTKALKANGMWENTLLIISSDNGGPSGTDGNAANNSPLRGGKYSDFQVICLYFIYFYTFGFSQQKRYKIKT